VNHADQRLRNSGYLLIRSSMSGHPDPFRSVRYLGSWPCPLFRPVRNPGRSFAPVAPSVAPRRRACRTRAVLRCTEPISSASGAVELELAGSWSEARTFAAADGTSGSSAARESPRRIKMQGLSGSRR